MFESIKNKYREYKEDKEFKGQVKQDISSVDELLKKQAREQARKEFMEKKPTLLEQRKAKLIEEERKKYEEEEKKLLDTRTTGQKFKEGMQTLGQKASTVGSRIGSDSVEWGSQMKSPNISAFDREVGGKLFFGRYDEMRYGAEVMQNRQEDMKQKLRPGQYKDKSSKVVEKVKPQVVSQPARRPFELSSGNMLSSNDKISQFTGMGKSLDKEKLKRFI